MPEQSTVWIDAFKVGSDVHHEDGSVTEVTTEFVTRLIENYEYCRSKNYAVVLLNNHARTDSNIYGDILGIRAYQGYVQCAVVFTRDQEAEAFESGIMREFSPGFDPDWLDPHDGTRRGPTLLELSFCGLAYQRNLRKPQEIQTLSSTSTMNLYALSSAQLKQGETMSRKKMSEMIEEEVELSTEEEEETVEMSEGEAPTLESLDAKLDQLMDLLKGVQKMASEMPEDDQDESEEKEETEEEVKSLHKRIRTLEDENTRIQLSQRGIRGDDANLLINLRRQDENLYNATLKRLSKSQGEIGVTGVTQVGATNDAVSVAKAAKKAGRVSGGDLVVYLSKNHPDFVERASEVRKALKTL